MLLSPYISPSSPLSLCPLVCSLCLFLHCCPANKFFVTIILDFGYMHSVQSLSRVRLVPSPWTAACQASLSITNSQSLLKLMPIESVMPSNHLILCHWWPLALSLSQHQELFQWVSSSHKEAKVLELQFRISPSKKYSGSTSFRIDWFDLIAGQGALKSLLQHHSSKASILYNRLQFHPPH